MKRPAQTILMGALLIALAALSEMRRGAHSDSAAPDRGVCCPFALAPGALPMLCGTNGLTINGNTNQPPATNHLQ